LKPHGCGTDGLVGTSVAGSDKPRRGLPHPW
jgi:hypothetical protein